MGNGSSAMRDAVSAAVWHLSPKALQLGADFWPDAGF